jgi:hypothetical protein
VGEPVRVRDHPVLGVVAFDEAMYWWETRSKVPLGGVEPVALTLTVSGEPELPAERFDEAAAVLRRLDPRILRRLVAEHYLELYNDTWCQDDDEELDEAGFMARIRPTSVDVNEDGVEIYFNDGGLFAEHSIVLSLDADLNLTDLKLAG